jgi:hypothetical protein
LRGAFFLVFLFCSPFLGELSPDLSGKEENRVGEEHNFHQQADAVISCYRKGSHDIVRMFQLTVRIFEIKKIKNNVIT